MKTNSFHMAIIWITREPTQGRKIQSGNVFKSCCESSWNLQIWKTKWPKILYFFLFAKTSWNNHNLLNRDSSSTGKGANEFSNCSIKKQLQRRKRKNYIRSTDLYKDSTHEITLQIIKKETHTSKPIVFRLTNPD